MTAPGMTSPHAGYHRLAERINQSRGRGIAGVVDCGSHNPAYGSNYWKSEPTGTLLYYSEVVVSETQPDTVGTGRNAIYRVTPTLVPAELLA